MSSNEATQRCVLVRDVTFRNAGLRGAGRIRNNIVCLVVYILKTDEIRQAIRDGLMDLNDDDKNVIVIRSYCYDSQEVNLKTEFTQHFPRLFVLTQRRYASARLLVNENECPCSLTSRSLTQEFTYVSSKDVLTWAMERTFVNT